MITFAFTIVFLFVLCARFVYLVMVYFIYFFFFGTFVFSFALWYSRFHGMESTFSLPYIAWVSCGNGWVHQVCTKWTGVTALCFRLGGEGLGREYQLANFQFSDENNPGLHSLCDWFRKRAPFSQPIGCKPKTDHDLMCSRTRGITVGLLLFFNVYFGFYRTENCHESTTVSFTVFKCVSMHQYSVLNEVRSFLWSQLCFFPESENWQRIESNLTAEGSEAASLSLTGISFTAIACDRLFIWGNALFFRYLWYYF